MSFSVSRISQNGLSLVRLQDNATNTIITILPEHGALLHSFEVQVNGESLNIIDNYTSRQHIADDQHISYKSSKLSPFVCRLANGKYKIDDEAFEVSQKFNDGHAIHGFLYNKHFKITSEFADENQASVSLRYHYKREDAGYPFDYVCEIRYSLIPQNVLQVETTILNLDTVEIPIADGWHPYFQLGGDNINDYEIDVSTNSMVELDNNLLPTGELIHDPSYFNQTALGFLELNNCYFVEPVEQNPAVLLYNPGNEAFVAVYTNSGYPYVQLFTPPHRKSIAIENLSGAPDCFNNGMGLVMLTPNQSQTFTVWYRAGVAEND